MKLPNAEKAIIDHRKLRDYALSTAHPVGRFKARYLRRLGFQAERWIYLYTALRRLARDNDAEELERTDFGDKYAVRGIIEGPRGTGTVVTIWIVLIDESVPRLVTLYPEH